MNIMVFLTVMFSPPHVFTNRLCCIIQQPPFAISCRDMNRYNELEHMDQQL